MAQPNKINLPTVWILSLAIGLIVVFVSPSDAPKLSVESEALWRRVNLCFLCCHLVTVGWMVQTARWYEWHRAISWKLLVVLGGVFAALIIMNLCAAFSWLGMGRSQSLSLITINSGIFVLFELLYCCSTLLTLKAWRIQYYSSRGNYDDALRLIEPRLRRAQISFYDQIAAGIFHLRLGHVEEGERLVEEGLARSNRDPVALTHVANARYIQERYAEGLALTDEVIAAIGTQPLLLLNRCVFLVALDRIAEARDHWAQVKQFQDPETLVPTNDRDGQLVLARVKSALGETEGSIAAAS